MAFLLTFLLTTHFFHKNTQIAFSSLTGTHWRRKRCEAKLCPLPFPAFVKQFDCSVHLFCFLHMTWMNLAGNTLTDLLEILSQLFVVLFLRIESTYLSVVSEQRDEQTHCRQERSPSQQIYLSRWRSFYLHCGRRSNDPLIQEHIKCYRLLPVLTQLIKYSIPAWLVARCCSYPSSILSWGTHLVWEYN